MSCRVFTTLFLCFYVLWCFHVACATDTCLAKLSAIRELLDEDVGVPDTCATCQGRPGKRGGVGPRGPIGPMGEKGDRGACECDLSAVNDLMEEIRALKDFKTMVQEGFRRNPSQYSDICYAGISTGRIALSQISASSAHSSCPLKYVVLNSARSWCAATNNAHQWVQVDLRSSKTITGVLTQGRKECCNQWVTRYKVSYGNNPSSLTFYKEQGTDKIFTGNADSNSIVQNVFARPINARYFRIHIVSWNHHISMRMELLTC